MKWTHIGNVGMWIGTMTMVLGSAAAVAAGPSSANGGNETQKAARLLRDIKADAVQVRSAATRLDKLTASPDAKWVDYDRQWNEIKPPVEDMQIKLARLESMQAAISPAERKEVDQSKQLIQEIQSRTRDLRALLDKPGVQTNDTKFKTFGTSLRNEAGKLEKTAATS